jgi:hypothetical protein
MSNPFWSYFLAVESDLADMVRFVEVQVHFHPVPRSFLCGSFWYISDIIQNRPLGSRYCRIV